MTAVVQVGDPSGGLDQGRLWSNGGAYLDSLPIKPTMIERAVVVDGEIVVRPMMYIALSYDHRVVDGKGAVGFLKTIKEIVEQPARVVFDV